MLAGEFFTHWPPGKPLLCMHVCVYTYAYTDIHNRILLRPKKSEVMPFATTWMGAGGIMFSEISQKERENILLSLICRA